METNLSEKRKSFLTLPQKDIKSSRGNFQISLRKKKKQEMFRKRRSTIMNENIIEAKFQKTSTKILFDELLITLPGPQSHSEEALKLLSQKFIDKTKIKDWLDVIKEPQFPKSCSEILKNSKGIFENFPEEACLRNTEKILEIFYNISLQQQEEIEVFFRLCLEEKVPSDLSEIFCQAVQKISSSEFLNSEENSEENIQEKSLRKFSENSSVKYYCNISVLCLNILGNLAFEFRDEIFEDLYKIGVFREMEIFLEILTQRAKMGILMEKEISEVIWTYNWYVYVLAYGDDDFPLNLTHHVFQYYIHLLGLILPFENLGKDLAENSEFKDTLRFLLGGLSYIINYKESNQAELLGTPDLLKSAMAVITEILTLDLDETGDCTKFICSILNSISHYERVDLFTECDVYKTCLSLLNSPHHSYLSELFAALNNFMKFSEGLLKTLAEKEAFLFLLKKGIEIGGFKAKYEISLLIEDLIELEEEIEDFWSNVCMNSEVSESLCDFCTDILFSQTQNQSLISVGLDLLKSILNLDQDRKAISKIQQEGIYSIKFKEREIGDKLINLSDVNEDIFRKAQDLCFEYSLLDKEELSEIGELTDVQNNSVFRSKMYF